MCSFTFPYLQDLKRQFLYDGHKTSNDRAGYLMAVPKNNVIFKVKNNNSRHFTVKGCLKYCDMEEF